MNARETFRKFRIGAISLTLQIAAVLFALAGVSSLIQLVSATGVAVKNPAVFSQSIGKTDRDEVIRVDTNLVTIPTSVMDRDGRYVSDLRKEDFQIFENNFEQEVAFFASVEQPFTILFLLDVSGSMTYRMDDLGRAANAFVSQLRSDDQLIVVTFDDWENVLFEAKVGNLRKSIKLRQRRGARSTMIYDAVDYALKRMRKAWGRKAIVLFSDGHGSGVIATAKRNLRDAEEVDALIYTIQFNTYPVIPPRYIDQKEYYRRVEVANNYLRNLAQKTGGRHYQVENISDLDKTFGLVADELRQQYTLGYYPKELLVEGERRQIKVKVRLPNLIVRARDNYIVDKGRAKGK